MTILADIGADQDLLRRRKSRFGPAKASRRLAVVGAIARRMSMISSSASVRPMEGASYPSFDSPPSPAVSSPSCVPGLGDQGSAHAACLRLDFEGRLRASLATGLRAGAPYSASRRSAQNGAVSLKICSTSCRSDSGMRRAPRAPEGAIGAITAVDSRRRIS